MDANAAPRRRKVGVTAEFGYASKVVVGTEEAAIRVVVIKHDADGTIYFEIQAARGHFPGKGKPGEPRTINGMIAPGKGS